MIIGFLGHAVGGIVDGELNFCARESRVRFDGAKSKVVPPLSTGFMFSSGEYCVHVERDSNTKIIVGPDVRWETDESFVGGGTGYLLFRCKDEQGGKCYLIRDWYGAEICRIPERVGRSFASHFFAMGDNDGCWNVYSADGQVVAALSLGAMEIRSRCVNATDRAFFFRSAVVGGCQVFDTKSSNIIEVAAVDDCLEAVLQLPNGNVLAVDFSGLKLFEFSGSGIVVRDVHGFESRLVRSTEVVMWHDCLNVYVAIKRSRAHQQLMAFTLDGTALVQGFEWGGGCSINGGVALLVGLIISLCEGGRFWLIMPL